jgi:hypothetical protein
MKPSGHGAPHSWYLGHFDAKRPNRRTGFLAADFRGLETGNAPCVHGPLNSRIVGQQKAGREPSLGTSVRNERPVTHISSERDFRPLPYGSWRAGAFSSVPTHVATGRELCGAQQILCVRRILARDRCRRLSHRLGFQTALALRSPGLAIFILPIAL